MLLVLAVLGLVVPARKQLRALLRTLDGLLLVPRFLSGMKVAKHLGTV